MWHFPPCWPSLCLRILAYALLFFTFHRVFSLAFYLAFSLAFLLVFIMTLHIWYFAWNYIRLSAGSLFDTISGILFGIKYLAFYLALYPALYMAWYLERSLAMWHSSFISGILSDCSFGAHWHLTLAVGVRQSPLTSVALFGPSKSHMHLREVEGK